MSQLRFSRHKETETSRADVTFLRADRVLVPGYESNRIDRRGGVLQGENLATAVLQNAIPISLHPESLPSGVTVSIDGRSIVLRAVWVGEGFPADGVRVLESLERGDPAGSPLPVVTARRMGLGAIRLLNERGVAWADAEGQAEISMPGGIHIYRLKPQRLPHRTAGVSWSRSSQTVSEYVLSRRAMPSLGHVRGWNGVDRVLHIAEG